MCEFIEMWKNVPYKPNKKILNKQNANTDLHGRGTRFGGARGEGETIHFYRKCLCIV